MAELIDPADLGHATAELTDWEIGDALVRTHQFSTFPDAVAAVAEVAAIAEGMDHHPDIDIRWRTVTFRCVTHSAGGITDLDVQLAAAIDAVIEGS
jgi:4a-hydroxytetrahydrobiopterin dehydratase